MSKIINVFMVLLFVLCSNNALAAKKPKGGKTDARMKNVTYNSRDVVQIHSHFKFGTHIILSPEEIISKVVIGDSIGWQTSVDKNHFFLKPLDDADTNLILLTNKRVYNFELHAGEAKSASDKTLTFQVQFHYPEDELAKQIIAQQRANKNEKHKVIPFQNGVNAGDWNFEYTRKGSDLLAPVRAFDDGKFTYFQFQKKLDLPAIFMVDDEKNESLVNFHVSGKYVVVERVAKQFILRHGDVATCVFNDAFLEVTEPSKLAVHQGD